MPALMLMARYDCTSFRLPYWLYGQFGLFLLSRCKVGSVGFERQWRYLICARGGRINLRLAIGAEEASNVFITARYRGIYR